MPLEGGAYMLNVFKLFSKKTKNQNNTPSKNGNIEHYFAKELAGCEFIKKECHDIVLKHLTHQINLNKTGNKLLAEEKKALGINTRLAITHDLVNVLTEAGLTQSNPKDILTSIYYRATFAKTNDDSCKQYIDLGVEKYKILACGDEGDCKWCKSMDGKKLSVSEDLNELIKNNCKCKSHCRLSTSAVLNF